MIEVFVHRSGISTYNRCARAYYWNYLHGGKGIAPTPRPIHFAIGTAVHEGLAATLRQLPHHRAVEIALVTFDTQVIPTPANLKELTEARVLVESIMWAWIFNGLERFFNSYTVLHIEEEVHHSELFLPEDIYGRQILIHWQSRPDAIVRERYGPTVVGISWKTIDTANEYRRQFFNYDLQGVLEQFFGSQHVQIHQTAPRVDAIQTILFEKGKRLSVADMQEDTSDHPNYSFAGFDGFLTSQKRLDLHSQYSPFFNEIHGLLPNVAWLTRYYRPGSKSYQNLPGFLRVPMQQAEVEGWIKALSLNQVFPTPDYYLGQSALDRIVIEEMPILRSDMQAEHAIREIRHLAARIALGFDDLQRASWVSQEFAQETLFRTFPRAWEKACREPVLCPYRQFCYTDQVPYWTELPQGFEWREPHHEFERLKAQGAK